MRRGIYFLRFTGTRSTISTGKLELKSIEQRLPRSHGGKQVDDQESRFLKRVYIDQPTGGRWVWVSISLEDGEVTSTPYSTHSTMTETQVLPEQSIQGSPKTLVSDGMACTELVL